MEVVAMTQDEVGLGYTINLIRTNISSIVPICTKLSTNRSIDIYTNFGILILVTSTTYHASILLFFVAIRHMVVFSIL